MSSFGVYKRILRVIIDKGQISHIQRFIPTRGWGKPMTKVFTCAQSSQQGQHGLGYMPDCHFLLGHRSLLQPRGQQKKLTGWQMILCGLTNGPSHGKSFMWFTQQSKNSFKLVITESTLRLWNTPSFVIKNLVNRDCYKISEQLIRPWN